MSSLDVPGDFQLPLFDRSPMVSDGLRDGSGSPGRSRGSRWDASRPLKIFGRTDASSRFPSMRKKQQSDGERRQVQAEGICAPPKTAMSTAVALAQPGAAREATTEEVLRDAEDAFPVIFSVHPPRDVLGGLWSGIKCVLSGVLFGLVGVIAQPVEGAREGGVVGCFKGAGTGLLVGLFFSITGLCTGIFQAVRGVAATPKAICMAAQGWKWNSENGTWTEPKVYSLPEEAAEFLDDDEDQDFQPRRKVIDTYYYDQLGVECTASAKEIRRAYFQKSRQCHPDKTSDNDAKERFQAISEAYQVLSDPKRRQDYDTRGRCQEGFIDAKVFFSVLLGADALAPYIGRLRITEMFGTDFCDSAPEEEQQLNQTRRQVKLAVGLAQRLDQIRVDCNGRFIKEAKKEARSILESDPSLGRFIAEIAWVYTNRAEWYLASLTSALGSWSMGAVSSKAHGRGREASQKAHTAKLAVKSFMQLRRIVKEADDKEKAAASTENAASVTHNPSVKSVHEELPEYVSSALPTFMETFWSLSSHDITGTLDKVIERVLKDSSISTESRCDRARALRELGHALQETAKASDAKVDGRECQRFEKAMMASMARD
eukprot:s140_g64.t1